MLSPLCFFFFFPSPLALLRLSKAKSKISLGKYVDYFQVPFD